MKFLTKDFIAAVDAISALPGGKLPEAHFVQFADGKLKRSTFEAYGEVKLEGATEGLIMDAQYLKRIKPSGETIEIVSDGQKIRIRSGKLSLERNPIMGELNRKAEPQGPGTKLVVPASAFKAALSASAVSDTRQWLNGVILHGDGHSLLVVGTNGQELHSTDCGESSFNERVTVSNEYAKLIPDGAVLTLHENLIIAETDSALMMFPIVVDRPPAMLRQAIPTEFDGFCSCATEEFENAVNSLARIHQGYIKLEFSSDRISLSSKDSEGNGGEEVEARCSREYRVNIKSEYLLSALPFLGDSITFSSVQDGIRLAIKHHNLTIALWGARLE